MEEKYKYTTPEKYFDTLISYIYKEDDISKWVRPKVILELLNMLTPELQNKLFHTKYTNDDPILVYLLRKYENNFNNAIYELICFGAQNFPDILDSTDKNGVTPLMIASMISQTDKRSKVKENMLSCLINSGANINTVDNFSRNALMFAISSGSEYAVNKFLKEGIDLLQKDKNNMSALDYALNQTNPKIINSVKNKIKKIGGKKISPKTREEELTEKDIEEIKKIMEEDTPIKTGKTGKRKASSISPGLFELSPFELTFQTPEEYHIINPKTSKKLFGSS